jgi:phosphate transport system ATP-binding protein
VRSDRRDRTGSAAPTAARSPRSVGEDHGAGGTTSDIFEKALLRRTMAHVQVTDLDAYYGSFKAVEGVSLGIEPRSVTAFIGPSGCGKSTLLRTLNRMHEVSPGGRVEGSVTVGGQELYSGTVDPVAVRRTVGMVFQRPNPFPTMSVAENVASGLRLTGLRDKKALAEAVETSLRGAHLWDEVKDRLNKPGGALSGGQQQRLCIARAIAVKPQVLLMDEPCSALDPGSTLAIEQLIGDLRAEYTIVIVTHTMQQAARVSDRTAFFSLASDGDAGQTGQPGRLVEVDNTRRIFSNPAQQATADYIAGRFG